MPLRKKVLAKTNVNGYADIAPLEGRIPAERQSAKRHYGVHPYFTRRPSNVVRKYILHYSKEGDRVLDPFGGSGVTAIEAFLENRVGIQNDINPLANFIAHGIANLAKSNLNDYRTALRSLEESCQKGLDEIHHADAEHLNKILYILSRPIDALECLARLKSIHGGQRARAYRWRRIETLRKCLYCSTRQQHQRMCPAFERWKMDVRCFSTLEH